MCIFSVYLTVKQKATRNNTTRFEVIRSFTHEFTRRRARGGRMAAPPQNVPQAIPQATPDIQMAVPMGDVTVTLGNVTVAHASPPLIQSNPTDELERLASLHASGMLSDEEFEQAKSRVLGLAPGSAPAHMGQPVMGQPAFGLFDGASANAVPMGQAV